MLKQINALVAAAALGGALLVAPPAAAATATTATTTTTTARAPAAPNTLTVSPSPVVVNSNAGTTATFTFKTADTGSARLVDPRGRVVSLSVTGTGTYTATHTFKFSDRAGSWKFQATATKHRRSTTASQTFEVHRATSLSFRASPRVVGQGGRVTLQGALTYQESAARRGSAGQYAGQKVHIAFKPLGGGSYSRVSSATTDRNGQFRVTQRASRSGWWRAEFEGTSATEPATSADARVDVRAPARDSRITGFSASPNPVAKNGTLHLRGTLQLGDRRHWNSHRSQQVKIMFKPDGGHGWRYVTSSLTDSHGRFGADVTATSAGSWRAEYAGARGVRGSVSSSVHVNLRAPKPPAATRIITFKADPKVAKHGRYVSFRGTLQRWDHRWKGYGHQQVTVQFKKAGSHHWSSVTTTRTNGFGTFYTKARATQSGAWRVVFTGNTSAKRSNSGTAYVMVRR